MAPLVSKRAPLALSLKRVQAISRALADPRRYDILKHIASQDRSACSELRECFPITPATLSHHIKELEASGLVETTKLGKFVHVHFCRKTWDAYLAALTAM